MTLVIVSLLDKKGRLYKNPFFVPNTDVAVRSLRGAVNATEQSDLTQYPEDFALYHLGTFDDETGLITPLAAPLHIMDALQLKRLNPVDAVFPNLNLHKDIR